MALQDAGSSHSVTTTAAQQETNSSYVETNISEADGNDRYFMSNNDNDVKTQATDDISNEGNDVPDNSPKKADKTDVSTQRKTDDHLKKGNPQSEYDNPPKKLASLADLIHVCRDRGLQVFSDKTNIPEADRLWQKARDRFIHEQRLSGYRSSSEYESPQDYRTVSERTQSDRRSRYIRSKHSRHSKTSRKSSRRSGSDQYSDSVSSSRRYHTAVSYNAGPETKSVRYKSSSTLRYAPAGSARHRSSATTRYDTLTVDSSRQRLSAGSRRETMTKSSVLSILDLSDDNGDIDAEEVLKLRMRRKSKRRREIDEMIQEKHKQIEALSLNRRTMEDDGNDSNDQVEEPDGTRKVEDLAPSNLLFKSDTDAGSESSASKSVEKATDGMDKNHGQEILDDKKGIQLTENKISYDLGTADELLSTSRPVQDNKDTLAQIEIHSASSKDRANENESTLHSSNHHDVMREQGTAEKIQELRIQDGNTTLVLYGVIKLPPSDDKSIKSSCDDNISKKSLTRAETVLSNDPIHEQENQSDHKDKTTEECQTDPQFRDYSDSNSKIIIESPNSNENMNEFISRGTDDNKEGNGKRSTGTNEFHENADIRTSSSSSISSFQDSLLFKEPTNKTENRIARKEMNLKSPSESEKLCHEGLNGIQSYVNSSCKEEIFNNSDDVKSDKNCQVKTVEQQAKIDGDDIKFKGSVIQETSTNKSGITETCNGLQDDSKRDKNEGALDHFSALEQDSRPDGITISLNNDDLIVEKQVVSAEYENTVSRYNSSVMEMPYNNNNNNNNNNNGNECIATKKSLGNEFLVSEDISKNGISSENGMSNSNDSGTEKEIKNDDNHGARTTEKSGDNGRQSTTTSSKTECFPAPSASSVSTPFKKNHGAAKLMLLMSQLKKTYEDEEKTQQSFLHEIGNTRKTLRTNYRKLQNGEDIEPFGHDGKSDASSKKRADESEVSIQLPTTDGDENQQNDADKNVNDHRHDGLMSNDCKLPTVNNEDVENIKNEGNAFSGDDTEKESARGTETDSTYQEEDVVERSLKKGRDRPKFDPVHYSVNENLKHAKPKIDSHWDHESPVYKQIKSGFKSKLIIPDASQLAKELKNLKRPKFVTGNYPSYNVYIEDARQRYMQILQTTNKKCDSGTLKPQANRVFPPKLGKETFAVNHKGEIIYAANSDFKSYTNERRSKTPHSKKTNISEGKNTPATIYNTTKPVPSQNEKEISHIPVRMKSYERSYLRLNRHQTNSDFEIMEHDKNKIKDYQECMNSKRDLPHVENRDEFRNTKNRTVSSNTIKKLQPTEFKSNIGYDNIESSQSTQSQNKSAATHHFENHSHGSVSGNLRNINSRDESVELCVAGSPKSCKTFKRAKMPIGKVVEIIQSRSRFYEDNAKYKNMSRELRILKLFEELQKLKFGGQHIQQEKPRAVSVETNPRRSTALRKFLWMEYGFSDFLLKYRSNLELNRFLHEDSDYEICSKGRHIYKQTNRKEKALDNLRQKLYPNLSVSHPAR